MALFKIFKGKSENLGKQGSTEVINEGFAYFTPDDGKFYIDVLNPGEIDKSAAPVVGNYAGEEIVVEENGNQVVKKANRICINKNLFNYNDYEILNCGDSVDRGDGNEIVFNCGNADV